MGRIAVSTLTPGMTLSKPVFNTYRQRLVEAGVTLDARAISLLQAWGIIDVEIQGITEPTFQEIETRMTNTSALQQISATIDERFYGADQHAFITELRRLVKYLALKEAEK